MLTPFQIEVQKVISLAIAGSDFALAGGGALISQGVIDRYTNDLDYFSTRSADVYEIAPKVISFLENHGCEIVIRQNSPTFIRLQVRQGRNELEVDFGLDTRLFPTQTGEFSPILSTRELAVDKVLAIFGRAAARDFLDFEALIQFFDIESIFSLAKLKDQGFSLDLFIEATKQFDRLPRVEFHISPSEYERLRESVVSWRERAQHLSRQQSRDRGMER